MPTPGTLTEPYSSRIAMVGKTIIKRAAKNQDIMLDALITAIS